MSQKPTIGRIVHYRGKQGLNTLRPAIITATEDTLDQRGVDGGNVPALDEGRVHLWVFTPSVAGPGGFAEFNVPFSEESGDDLAPGSWCWPPRS